MDVIFTELNRYQGRWSQAALLFRHPVTGSHSSLSQQTFLLSPEGALKASGLSHQGTESRV